MTYKANRATYDSDQLKAAQTAAAQATHRQGMAELKVSTILIHDHVLHH